MSFSSVERNAFACQTLVQQAISEYKRSSANLLPLIKNCLNNRLKFTKLTHDKYTPRIINDEDEKLDLEIERLSKEFAAFESELDDAQLVLRRHITKAQNGFVKLKELVHSTEAEFGLLGLELEWSEGGNLLQFVITVNKSIENFWMQYHLDSEIINTMKNCTSIKHQTALFLSSSWTYLPYL